MGLRGPKQEPAPVKLAKGERRPSRINRNEPELPAPESLEAPEGLSGAGLKEWQRIGGVLRDSGIMRQTDLVLFEDYCRTLTDLRTYERVANAAGAEDRIEKGFLGAVVKLRGQLNQLRRELGG
jgi:phage terminase small subunit